MTIWSLSIRSLTVQSLISPLILAVVNVTSIFDVRLSRRQKVFIWPEVLCTVRPCLSIHFSVILPHQLRTLECQRVECPFVSAQITVLFSLARICSKRSMCEVVGELYLKYNDTSTMWSVRPLPYETFTATVWLDENVLSFNV